MASNRGGAQAFETESGSSGSAPQPAAQNRTPLFAGIAVVAFLIIGGITLYFINNNNNGGGNGSNTSGDSSNPTTTIPGIDPDTDQPITTTTTLKDTGSVCVYGGNIADCVSFLNAQFHGYDASDPTSPLGVTIRGQPRFEPTGWFYCTTECFRGQPDCLVTASLLNSVNMYNNVTLTAAMPMGYKVGIVFQPKVIEERIMKCSWAYDGGTFNRLNGGCGCGWGPANCTDPMATAFGNLCPTTGEPAIAGQCPQVDRCACDNVETTYPEMCYWKGPAYYNNASSDAPPNMTVDNNAPNQLRNMMEHRLRVQDNNNTILDNVTSMKTYWNEITIDGKLMAELMKQSLSDVIAAIVYQKGDVQAQGWSVDFNVYLNDNFGGFVPVVALDTSVQVTASEGPFYPEESKEELV